MAVPGLLQLKTTNTFQNWLDSTNNLISLMQNNVLTASAIGDSTTGNATLIGSFTANTLTASVSVKTDLLTANTSGGSINITSPFISNTSIQNTATFKSTLGPTITFSGPTVNWIAGFNNTANNDFTLGISTNTSAFTFVSTGELRLRDVTATGNVSATYINGNGAYLTNISTANNLTLSSTGNGANTGTIFNGSTPVIISYNSIGAPSTNGTNATGTWNISISGNAATANSATLASTANTANSATLASTANTANALNTNNSYQIKGLTSIGGGSSSASAVVISNSNGYGGTGYSGLITLANSAATNGNKFVRINPTGGLEVVNSVYNSVIFTLADNGDLTSSGNITAYSDIKLKKDITKIENALDKVTQLAGYTFTMKASGARQTGVIAQEVEKVLPEAVVGDDIKSVAYGNMIGLLIEAIKEIKEELDELKGKI